ncbi:unnamed protein product [Closterium sp. NIES-54]
MYSARGDGNDDADADSGGAGADAVGALAGSGTGEEDWKEARMPDTRGDSEITSADERWNCSDTMDGGGGCDLGEESEMGGEGMGAKGREGGTDRRR